MSRLLRSAGRRRCAADPVDDWMYQRSRAYTDLRAYIDPCACTDPSAYIDPCDCTGLCP